MLRKALQGAAVAGAAAALALGSASPAMAGGGDTEYEYDPDDFGGVNILSNLCLDVSDIVQLVDVDVLTGGFSCDFVDSEVHANGNEVEIEGEQDGWHHDN